MTYDVLINPDIFKGIPEKHVKQIKKALPELSNPFPGSDKDKQEVKGTNKTDYKLRVGKYRIFYRINEKEKTVIIFDILTAEQAHKKYGRLC
jgi:mRNA interferase RelE/StbE